jgi:hypothetical protein
VSLPLTAGCLFGEKRQALSVENAELFRAKADLRLRKEAETGGSDPFAAIAVFRNDVFLDQSESLLRSSLTVLNEMGNAAILLLRPNQILPMLKDPSLRKLAWFGPQGRLARLEPSLELDLLARYGKGSEGNDAPFLARFRSVPGEAEERLVIAAGYRILSRGGPNLVISGPWSGVPRLLEIEWVIYLEKGTGLEEEGIPGGKVTKELPHSKESVSDMKDRDAKEPPPSRGDVSIPFRSYPRGDNNAVPPQTAPGNGGSR